MTHDRYTIKDIICLFEYSHADIRIDMLSDDGDAETVLKDTTVDKINLCSILDYLDEEVYGIHAENNVVVISFCDPCGEWK